MAVTHNDTDNRHIHIIANRISLYGEVYDTTFVSNRAARVAEEISREKGLTIAKEVKAERKHQKAKANPTREQTKQQIQKICYALLEKYKGTGIMGHSMFLYELNKNGIAIERMKNKQGNVYGLKFSYCGQTFKASEIGREFGYRSLQKNFEPTNREEPRKHTKQYRRQQKRTNALILVTNSYLQAVPLSHETMTHHKCRILLVQWQTPLLVQPMN